MKFNLVHLTDIHIKTINDPILRLSKGIGRAISTVCKDVDCVIVLVSGDIAFSGQNSQYELAEKFFTEISDEVFKETDINVRYLFCPGNHDSDFSQTDRVREIILGSLRKGEASIEEEEVQEILTKNQGAFFEFKRRMEKGERYSDKIWHRTYESIGEATVRFDLINVASCSSIKESLLHF